MMTSFYLRAGRLLLALLLLARGASAGTIRGTVSGTDGKVLPFANVAVRGTSTSTGANEAGQYQLRLPAGAVQLVFQYVGYRPRIEVVRVPGGDSTLTLNVALQPEAYSLGEVTVRGTDRDPAYAIMQRARQWRAYHNREVASFRARLYLKSLVRLSDTPSKVLGLFKVGPDLKPGILYLAESLSDISFQQPNVVKSRMLSGRISGNTRGIPIEQATAGARLDFYENTLPLGQRRYVSPLAGSAEQFYTFALVGTTQQGGQTIHKIRVAPRRRADPAFSGFVYIVDGSWRLQGVDLSLNKDSQLDYVDELHIEQLYAPAPTAPHVWLVQSQKATVSFAAFGFKGSGYATASLSDYSRVVPTYPAPPAVKSEELAVKSAQDVAPVTTKELTQQIKQTKPDFAGLSRAVRRQVRKAARDSARAGDALDQMPRGAVQLVEKGVTDRDTSYWAKIRPMPLTAEERLDYRKKDSTETRRRSRPYQDSLDRVRNRVKLDDVPGLLLGGYTYNRTFLKRRFYVGAPFNELQYNTVEGYVANLQATYSQRTDDRRFFNLTPALRYGFQNQQLQPSFSLNWQLDPVRQRQVSLTVGRTVENFDRNSQLTPFVNSFYSLLSNLNYAKLYRRDGAELGYTWEPVNGLTMRTTVAYFERQELFNTSTYLWRDVPGRAFTPNRPVAEEADLAATAFGQSKLFNLGWLLSYKPGQQYILRPDGKFNFGSNWPTFTFQGRLALPDVLGSQVRYLFMQGGVRHAQTFGLVGVSSVQLAVGGFAGESRNLTFADFRHFAGNRLLLAASFDQFQLLDYYQYSTRRSFLELHYNHHFNGYLFGRLPLLRRLGWQEVVSLNYLRTAQIGHYLELGGGIEHVFKTLRVDFYTALQSGERVGTGVRIGVGI